MGDPKNCPSCGCDSINKYCEWTTMSSAEVVCDACGFRVYGPDLEDAIEEWNSVTDALLYKIEKEIRSVKSFLSTTSNFIKNLDDLVQELKARNDDH